MAGAKGLAEGLGSGFQFGAQIFQKAQANKIAKQRAEAAESKAAVSNMGNFLKAITGLRKEGPAFIQAMGPAILEGFGLDPKSDQFKGLIKFLSSDPDDASVTSAQELIKNIVSGLSGETQFQIGTIMAGRAFKQQFREKPLTAIKTIQGIIGDLNKQADDKKIQSIISETSFRESDPIGKKLEALRTRTKMFTALDKPALARATTQQASLLSRNSAEIQGRLSERRKEVELQYAGQITEARKIAELEGEQKSRVTPRELRFLNLPVGKNTTRRKLATEDGITIPSPERMKDLNNKATSLVDLGRNMNNVIRLIKGNPKLFQAAGSFSKLVNNFTSGIRGIKQLFVGDGKPIEVDGVLTALSESLKSIGVVGQQAELLQSSLSELAYTMAGLKGQTGRALSDKDVVEFAKQVGKAAKSPEAMETIMRVAFLRMSESFEGEYKRFTGKFRNIGVPAGEKQFKNISREQLDFITKDLMFLVPTERLPDLLEAEKRLGL